MDRWNVNSIPDLYGKIAVVTGGNTGLGYQSSLELARKKAKVVLLCRSVEKGEQAVSDIKAELGHEVDVEAMQADLADFNSIKRFTVLFKEKYDRLDILMNNAGVVNQKERGTTKNGWETHMGTNHLGHFLLTGLLLDLLKKTAQARVVTLSSGGYKQAAIDFEDLNWEKRTYHRIKSYGDSKLANLLFTMKLQQYFEDKNWKCIAVSAHPGLSASPRQQSIGIGGRLSKWLASPLWRGSRPQLMAATAQGVKGNDFYGPKYGIDGPPQLISIKHKQYTQAVADQLWAVSEEITGFEYE